eukprot:9248480-Alexandrium_andersonii.AAC.1
MAKDVTSVWPWYSAAQPQPAIKHAGPGGRITRHPWSVKSRRFSPRALRRVHEQLPDQSREVAKT